jgi:TRAP transporter 4TM/12TM fusion protein
LTGIAAVYISLFVIFGAILLTSGGGKTLIDLALLLTGRYRGGPAKVAVIASSVFGRLSGSSLANVATTGAFTIPLTKSLGYQPKFAGAVEAVASTGGSIMPPIMGTAAFIMAEFLGIPYLQIIIAAFVPAILFYTSVFMGVHFQAVKLDLKPVPAEQRPKRKDILTYPRISCLAIPVGVLMFFLARGYSLSMVGGTTCTAAILAYIFSDVSWNNMKERLRRMLPCLEAGGKALMFLTPVLVCANIVLGLLIGTGLIMKFSHLLVSFGQENLWLSLGIVALLVMILGTGLPATASYVIGVAVGASLLIGWGILPLAAHLFIFYFSRVAVITPPVCAAVFIASSIAQSEWLPTGITAVKLAPLLYLMPFIFVGDNTFLLMGPIPLILLNVSSAIFGVIILASGIIGQFIVKNKRYERLAMIAAGLFLLTPGWQLDLLGAILSAAVIARQILQRRKEAQLTG